MWYLQNKKWKKVIKMFYTISKVKNKSYTPLPISHRVLRLAIIELAYMIKNSGKQYNSLYGIPRGGQIIAVYLSHQLDLPIVEKDGINKDTLICDDISDSGSTLYEIYNGYRIGKNMLLDTATLFYRKNVKFKPTYWSQDANNSWIQFPWEIK